MLTRAALLRRILWPGRASLFAVVGAAAGLLTDFVAFLANYVTPIWPLAGFAIVAIAAAAFCISRAFRLPAPVDDSAAAEVADCAHCDAFRFGLFGVFAFLLVLAIGDGGTATEAIGARLGIIEQKIDTMAAQVDDIAQITQPQMIIENPSRPADHFNNAWLLLNVRRDPSAAWQSLQALYAAAAPRKMDAAEMYFNVGKNSVPRSQLLADMRRLGEEKGDATLLVIAGRNATDTASADALYEAAQRLDATLPFAYWDMQRPELREARMVVGAAARDEQAAAARRKIASIEAFLARVANKPVGSYFYLPQYQADFEQVARQYLTLHKSTLGILDADYTAIAREKR